MRQQQQQQRVRAAAVFMSQSCSVFLCCDISTVTVLIRGSRDFPSLRSDHLHALHYCLRLTRQQQRGTGIKFKQQWQGSENTQLQRRHWIQQGKQKVENRKRKTKRTQNVGESRGEERI